MTTQPCSKQGRPAALVLILAICISACCSVALAPKPDKPEHPALERTHLSPARGTFLVVHGLNQKPSTMEPLGEYLRSLGFNTYRVVLTGHSTPHDTSFPASSWVDDIRNAYTSLELANRALPIHIAAFSLGGLVTTRALDIFPELKPKSILFIAPALSLRALVQSAYLLHVLPPLTLGVPNIAPPYYRRFPHTPLFWYRNTIELYAQTRSLASHERLQSIPTLIIANPRDELVSLSGLTEWIKDNRLAPAWRLEVVRPARREPFMPEHLLVDRGSFGESEWQRFTVRTGEFLR